MNENTSRLKAAKGNGSALDLMMLTLVWLLAIVIVNPIGDFPLNDDWSFGMAVEYFIQQGNFHPTGWTAMSLITNVVWGSLFCLPAGFSFTALRLSTLTASLLGIWGMYWLMKEIRQPRPVAFLGAFVMAFNPLYFSLSNTFMTDVPCLTLMIFSALFFLKNLKTGSLSSLVLATIFSLASVLSRQVGLAVPLAFAIVAICQRGFKTRAVWPAVSPLVLGIIVLAAFQHWLKISGRLPALYNFQRNQLFSSVNRPGETWFYFSHNVYICFIYLGLFLSPLLLFFGLNSSRRLTWKNFAGVGFILAVLIGFTVVYGYYGDRFTMPFYINLLIPYGMGPLTLRDAFYFVGDPFPPLPKSFWLAITSISLMGAVLLIYRIYEVFKSIFPKWLSFKPEPKTFAGAFLLLIPVIYIAPFMPNSFLDRYLIPMIPFLIGGLAAVKPSDQFLPSKFCRSLAIGLAAGFFVFSICGARDYLAWNRTRWLALDELMENDKVQPSNIDGGMEFNGYYLYSPVYQDQPGKSYWWVKDDSYLVTFGPVPGYNVFREYHYTHWMPSFTGNIYVLKKNPQNPGSPPSPSGSH